MGYSKACIVKSAVAATTIVLLWWWWRRRKTSGKSVEKPPSKWRKVGELSDIIVFPIKSLGPMRMTSMECTYLGLKSGWVRDRSLMVVDLTGHFITGRQRPNMVQVAPTINGTVLTLNAPGMMSISIDLSKLRSKRFDTTVWEQIVPAQDCGEDVARWLSRYILQEETGLRLVYYPLDRTCRDVRDKNKGFPRLEYDDAGVFPDSTSYCLINESSIADLNTRVEEPVTPLQFRPNFVIKGAEAFEEDDWDWVKIGDILFRNVMPCTRCIFTTVDPETGTKNGKMEPLNTLKSYRQITDPSIRAYTGDSPVMGTHLGLRDNRSKLMVNLGDPVYVSVPDEEQPCKSPP